MTRRNGLPNARTDAHSRKAFIFCSPAFLLFCSLLCVQLCSSAAILHAAAITDEQLAAVRAVERQRIETVQKVYGAVVAVYGKNRQGGGSGVIFDPEGYALTNFHVVRSTGPEGFGGLADGHLYPYKLIGLDPGGDIALIKLNHPEGKPFPYVAFGDDDTVHVGDFVMAMGNPFVLAEDQTPTVTLGIVSGVKRYQEGQGGTNVLEYGDCIQIDSSINPGNSGGPLFSLRGDLIGINGRGSFEERGRVNVGVGYAIGINQIKRFLPDLLATKIAMHATLKATFGTRAGVTVCDQIDLDSKAYEAGLRLGDKLLRFDGLVVTSANQFKNHLTTLPAGWPVELVWERDGKEQSAWLRLDAAPYPKAPPRPQPRVQPKPKAEPKPGEKDDEKPGDDKPDDGDDKPADAAKQVAPPPEEPGKIRDAKQNTIEVQRILRSWARFAGVSGENKRPLGLRLETESYGEKDGVRTLALRKQELQAIDGRFATTTYIPRLDRTERNWWDGQRYFTDDKDGTISERDTTKLPALSDLTWARLYDALTADDAVARFKQIELRGADAVSGQPCYHLYVVDRGDNVFDVWFSVFDKNGRDFQVRLVKATTSGSVRGGLVYDDYRSVGGLMVAHRMTVVIGDSLMPSPSSGEIVVTKAEPLSEITDAMFLPPDVKP